MLYIFCIFALIVKMTTMIHAGKFPTTNGKIHHRNPSWKSILPKHAKSQTYSADSEPLRRFRKLCPRRFFVGFQKFGSHFTHILLQFSYLSAPKISRHMAFLKMFHVSRLGFSASCIYIILYHIMNYTIYIICIFHSFPLILNL